VSELPARIAEVRERIAEAARRAGRDPSDVTLVGASKTVDPERLREAIDAGLVDLGENRAQELLAKAPVLAASGHVPRWHFVGRLQRNKVAALAPHVVMWHSVDRPALGDVIARQAPSARVLVEVNLGDEAQKGGVRVADAGSLVDHVHELGLAVEGLMTIPPRDAEPRRAFATLRELAGDLGVTELSMGMSDDYDIAVEEGATIVRIGRAIFGPRQSV
jgi:pyridoxal phosphate enzyme (YggS family)